MWIERLLLSFVWVAVAGTAFTLYGAIWDGLLWAWPVINAGWVAVCALNYQSVKRSNASIRRLRGGLR